MRFFLGYLVPFAIVGLFSVGVSVQLATLLTTGATLAYTVWRWAVDCQGVRVAAWLTGVGLFAATLLMQEHTCSCARAAGTDTFTRGVVYMWLLLGPCAAIGMIGVEWWRWFRRSPASSPHT